MSCYKCGDAAGSEAKLCPKCNEEKRAALKTEFKILNEGSDEARLQNRKQQAGMFAAVCAALAISLYVLLFAPFGPGYGLSKGEQAFRRCMSKLDAASAKVGKGNDAVAQQFQKAAEAMMTGMMTAGCEAVRRACDKDAGGEVCKAAFNL